MYDKTYGPGSSVGIATDNRLEGPGSDPGGDEIFRPSLLYRVFSTGKMPPYSAAAMED